MTNQNQPGAQSSDYNMRREKIQREINRNVRPALSFQIFEKTESEKAALRKAKAIHRNLLRSEGFDPKKRLNINEPMRLLYNS